VAGSVSGKTAFVTGPARGIGAEVARRLAARGARVALAGLEPARLADLARELGPQHAWFECDVTDQAALDRAAAGAVERLGGIDIVVANAGIATNGTVAVTPVEALTRVIDVNLAGVVRTIKTTLPHVAARRGYFLIVSSAAAFGAMPGLAVYAATKSAVEQFGNALRYELADRGVAVGIAHPSWIDTDLVRDVQRDLQTFNDTLRRLPGPLGRVTSLADCGAALVDAIEHRKPRIYVPRGLSVFALLRHLLATPPFDAVVRKHAAKMVPAFEREVAALGRPFGQNSVETARRLGVGERGPDDR
jgi:NAD(P)-dependent dehydrogenase (short-subunit alcohol dehydrogenase family)